MEQANPEQWRQLLTILLAQRLEMNAVESALLAAGIVTDQQIKALRAEVMDTAKAWSARDDDDVLALLRVHSSPAATMSMPAPRREETAE